MVDLSHIPRILLLEDDGLIALDVETTLQDAGAREVTAISTIEGALRAVDGSVFDAAILDLRIGADGWAYPVADRLRQKGVPFLFSSGSEDISEAYRDVPLVMKPFSSDQLVAALAKIACGPSTAAA